MLTRAGYGLLFASVLLLLAGVPTGNLFLVTVALVPLVLFILGAGSTRPRSIDVRLVLPDRPVRVGDTLTVTLQYTIRGGTGLVELHQRVPDIFELTRGNNLLVLPKGAGVRTGTHSFDVRATRRGRFAWTPASWEHVPALGLSSGTQGTSGEERWLDVRPALASMRHAVRARGKADRPFPDQDDARLGVATTEFRDIRGYQRGDPPKTINWKATARRQSRQRRPDAGAPGAPVPPPEPPLVNEYEHEGKKTTWIFLDCGPDMATGTNAENAFESSVHAAYGAARHFSERGYRVGFTLFDRHDPVHLYPETGRRRLHEIQERLAAADTTSVRGDLPRAVEEAKRFLLQGRALVLVFTRADLADGTLLAGLRRLRDLTVRRGHRRPPVFVCSPDPYGLLPDAHLGTETARLLVRQRHEASLASVRRLGVTVIHWDPRTSRFERHLLARTGGV